jgi:DNA-directed RNA polymerase subunit F
MPIVIEPESGIPFPFDTQPEEIPLWCDRAKLAVASIRDLIEMGASMEITPEDRQVARQAVAEGKTIKITEKNAGQLAVAEAILSEYDFELLNVAARLRNFVTNKLIVDAENEDPKVRLKALELLGKVTSVGLFSERIDINVTHRTVEQIDTELEQLFEKYLGEVEEVKPETADELQSLLAMSDEEIGVIDVEVKEKDAVKPAEAGPAEEA